MKELATGRLVSLSTSLYGWCLGIVMTLICSPVWAQAEDLRPPKTAATPSNPKFITMAIALLLVGAAVFAVTLKSKRGHQD